MNNKKYLCLVLIILIFTIIIVLHNSNNIINFVKEKFEDHDRCIEYIDFSTIAKDHKGPIKYSNRGECKEPCQPGTFVSRDHQSCVKCPLNEFTDTINAMRCNSCGENEMTLATGSTKCVPNEYLSEKEFNDDLCDEEDLSMDCINAKDDFNELKHFAKEVIPSYQELKIKSQNTCGGIDDGYGLVLNRFEELQNTNNRIEQINKTIEDNIELLKENASSQTNI